MISNIDQMTRRELVEIVKIQVEEFQELHKRVAELEGAMNTLVQAVLDNRSKRVTIKTLQVVRDAIDKFDLRRTYKKEQDE